jgi:UDP-N-acetyl-D-mannosaminuronic acid transferase (WecB/TagA/CpsF family)
VEIEKEAYEAAMERALKFIDEEKLELMDFVSWQQLMMARTDEEAKRIIERANYSSAYGVEAPTKPIRPDR